MNLVMATGAFLPNRRLTIMAAPLSCVPEIRYLLARLIFSYPIAYHDQRLVPRAFRILIE